LGKKQRRNLSVLQSSLSPELEIVTSTLATFPDRIDLSKVALPTSNPFEPSDEMYKEMLISHKRKKKRIEQVCYFNNIMYVVIIIIIIIIYVYIFI